MSSVFAARIGGVAGGFLAYYSEFEFVTSFMALGSIRNIQNPSYLFTMMQYVSIYYRLESFFKT